MRQINDLKAGDMHKDLARVVATLFEKWGLSAEEELSLLGMSLESRKVLAAYRRGERTLPDSPDTLERARYLLNIHKGLRLLFPENAEMRYGWVKFPNRVLEGKTPLKVMLDDGLVGVVRIARFIDFQLGQ